MVSVPLRGKGRDQQCLIWFWQDTPLGFPSPCGEKVGINYLLYCTLNEVTEEFPSPCGEKVGINCPL